MLVKTVSFFVIAGLLVSCSSKPKQVPIKEPVKKLSWQKILGPTSYYHSVHRRPASEKKPLPAGAEEFLNAVKSHPQLFTVPIGTEVVFEDKHVVAEETVVGREHFIYLHQNQNGYFALNSFGNLDEPRLLKGFDNPSFSSLDIKMELVKEVKKVDETKYRVIASDDDDPQTLCGIDVDLTKSIELAEMKCVDKLGNITASRKVASLRRVNLALLSDELKEKRLVLQPRFLDNKVVDQQVMDWSHLVR